MTSLFGDTVASDPAGLHPVKLFGCQPGEARRKLADSDQEVPDCTDDQLGVVQVHVVVRDDRCKSGCEHGCWVVQVA